MFVEVLLLYEDQHLFVVTTETPPTFLSIALTNTNVNMKLKFSKFFKICSASEISFLFLDNNIIFVRAFKIFRNSNRIGEIA